MTLSSTVLPPRPPAFRGNWATLLLPIRENEKIDYDLLAREVDHFLAAGVNGIYSNGSAGEFHTQTETEFDRVSALLADRCHRANTPFQIGACHMSAQLSLERVRRARALQPAAFQMVIPDWFQPTFAEIVRFFERVIEKASPIPIVLYHPPQAKRQLSVRELAELVRRFPAIVGLKVPGGDAAWFQAMQPVLARASVFIPGHMLASGLAAGAHGAYSNVACLNPRGAQAWFELCQRDPDAGRQLEERIQRFWYTNIRPLITEDRLCNAAADKAAAAAGGWLPRFPPRVRWPYQSASAARVRAIRRAACTALPEWFE